MNKDYTEKEIHSTYCSNCCQIFSYVVEVFYHYIYGGEEREDKEETKYFSQLNSTKCPNCGNLQQQKVTLDDLKNLKSNSLTERQIFEIYLRDKNEIKIKYIDDRIEDQKEMIEGCQRRINSLTETRDFSIKKRDSIEGNEYFKYEYQNLDKTINNCNRDILLNEKGIISCNGKITELNQSKLNILLSQ